MNDPARGRTGDTLRGATFISYDDRDVEQVHAFLDTHRQLLGPIRSVGVTTEDAIARYADERHILDEVARRYVGDAELTLVLVGEHTWTRRFVDWEVAAAASAECGILAVPLHTAVAAIPARVRLLAEASRAIVADHPPTSSAEFGEWLVQAQSTKGASDRVQPMRAMKTPLMRRDAQATRR